MLGLVRKATISANSMMVNADATSLPFQTACIDCVLAAGLFAYIPDPEATFREVHRICRPGGLFMLTNAVRHPMDKHLTVGTAVGFRLVEPPAVGNCHAATGDVKERYLLVFDRGR
jgi:ubiquinone/menaquinone biosynthesis C-methylase UbiE